MRALSELREVRIGLRSQDPAPRPPSQVQRLTQAGESFSPRPEPSAQTEEAGCGPGLFRDNTVEMQSLVSPTRIPESCPHVCLGVGIFLKSHRVPRCILFIGPSRFNVCPSLPSLRPSRLRQWVSLPTQTSQSQRAGAIGDRRAGGERELKEFSFPLSPLPPFLITVLSWGLSLWPGSLGPSQRPHSLHPVQ